MIPKTENDEYPEIYPPAYAALEKLWEIEALVEKLRADVNHFIGLGVPPSEALVLRNRLELLVGEPGDFSSLDVSEDLFKASKSLNEKRKAAQASECHLRHS